MKKKLLTPRQQCIINMPWQFCRFLIEKKALTKFLDNFAKEYEKSDEWREEFFALLSSGQVICERRKLQPDEVCNSALLSWGFNWDESNEGFDYWYKIFNGIEEFENKEKAHYCKIKFY